jgi:archaellum component FlaD/FlaE
MNEKAKRVMNDQQTSIIEKLESTFEIPVVEDELTEDEVKGDLDNFLIIYGDFVKVESKNQLNQEVYVIYLSENKADLETMSVDVISTISAVKALEFVKTIKRRTQKNDTDSYIDQITFIFKRLVPYEVGN